MGILLKDEGIDKLFPLRPNMYTYLFAEDVARAQHAADAKWLGEPCPHPLSQRLRGDLGMKCPRRDCPTCWAEFTSAGKE